METYSQELRPFWYKAHVLYGIIPIPGKLEEICALYDAPKRFYHNTEHVYCTLVFADSIIKTLDIEDYEIVAKAYFAIFFHDMLDSEDESAAAASEYVSRVASPYPACDISKAILDTKTHTSDTVLGKIVCDADMSILMANHRVYKAYAEKVRMEYVPHKCTLEQYLTGRRDFLLKLYNDSRVHGKRIYHYAEMDEEKALTNILEEITEASLALSVKASP